MEAAGERDGEEFGRGDIIGCKCVDNLRPKKDNRRILRSTSDRGEESSCGPGAIGSRSSYGGQKRFG